MKELWLSQEKSKDYRGVAAQGKWN